ncbi:unnamed protein product [Kuraishia capsulata CBS 1993]|uniref:F-box domain-containing protein n=1 Tax=Kuraishia capsulata CBS 1993 TaxID=1382522 RepID=W6MP03_9ASCO|nr:uncharacterized protein KUCA_T00002771001 [Kuraishia capsulata CBS 1993]CDK26797.1 unnamed protein product [Kuraishia capsulata CBS 1993]
MEDQQLVSLVPDAFNILDLPAELMIRVFRYLDYADLLSLSRTNSRLRNVICDHYFNYILSLRNMTVKYKLNRWLQLLRPTRAEVFRMRMLNYRSFFYVFESGISENSFQHQFEVIRLFNAMLTRDRLRKLLAQRPTRSELIVRGILKPEQSDGSQAVNYANGHNSQFPLKTKIDRLEQENLSEILRLFIRGYERNRKRKNKNFVEFMRTVNFFESLVRSSEGKPFDKCVKKKVLLNVQIEGGRVRYV